MPGTISNFRLTVNQQIDQQIADTDSFAGRKTQEPFSKELSKERRED